MRQAFVRERLDYWFATEINAEVLVFVGKLGISEKEVRLELSQARLAGESIVGTTVSCKGETFDVIMLDVIDPLPTKLRYPTPESRTGCLFAVLSRFK